MKDLERRYPVICGITEGAATGALVAYLSPFNTVGTAFIAATAMLVSFCIPDAGLRPRCQFQKKATDLNLN